MKYKITYQKERKLKQIVLEASSINSLQKLDTFPTNIIKIKEIKDFYYIDITAYKDSKKDVYEFFAQLNIMLGANLTFSQSIDLLLESEQVKNIEEVLKIIQQSLSSSIPVDKALAKYKKYLGEISILFLKLGFENGNLKESIHSLVEILGEDIRSKEKLKDAMRYPLILILSLFLSIGMIFIYVIPNFEFIFTLQKNDIPFATYILISVKEILDKYWILFFLGIGLITVFTSFVIKRYKYKYDKIIIRYIPIFSNMIKDYYFYRLFLSISIIVKSKYQFQVAIENSKNIVSNIYIQERMQKVLINIKNGISISESFKKSNLFDNFTMKLLSTADNTNNYELILLDITVQYKKRFYKSLKNFSSTIEPLLIFFISLIVLWLILAIMLPIWNLGSIIN